MPDAEVLKLIKKWQAAKKAVPCPSCKAKAGEDCVVVHAPRSLQDHWINSYDIHTLRSNVFDRLPELSQKMYVAAYDE